jgi:hypothetical protein
MSSNQTWINAKGVLKAETLKVLANKLTRQGTALVDGWAASNPKQVKEWEASGELLTLALEAQNKAQDSVAKARADGMTHLADHEIYELYGGPNLRL